MGDYLAMLCFGKGSIINRRGGGENRKKINSDGLYEKIETEGFPRTKI